VNDHGANQLTLEKDRFETFRRRPIMFTGKYSIGAVRSFLEGYACAMANHGLLQEEDPFLVPHEFHDWVAYRLHFYESTSGWNNMIRERSETEEKAIERFFVLLEEFRTRTPRVVGRVNSSYTILKIDREGDQVIRVDEAEMTCILSLSIITFTDDPGFFTYPHYENGLVLHRFYPDMEIFENFAGISRSDIEIVDANWIPQDHPHTRE
jgi:hypothetical protein